MYGEISSQFSLFINSLCDFRRLIKTNLISAILMCLISKFGFNKVTIELHLLPSLFDIGRDTPSISRFLVNSGNEYLVGARLPYFPRGGLTGRGPANIHGDFQPWQSSGGWGGLSAGPDMVYPVQCIDGEVRQCQGFPLQLQPDLILAGPQIPRWSERGVEEMD